MLVRRPSWHRYADHVRHPDRQRVHPGRLAVVATVTVGLIGVNAVVAHGDSTPNPSSSTSVGTAVGGSALTPTTTNAPLPTSVGIAKALVGALRAPALGARVGFVVVDALTGQPLYDSRGSTPQQPASTMKLLTAAAVLSAYGPDHRLTTRVVRGSGSTIVLIGGGDATLASSRTPTGISPAPAKLSTLADRVTAALKATKQAKVALQFDDHLFTGPRMSPAWSASYVASGVVAPVSSLSVDGGRRTPTSRARASDPAAAAAAAFAVMLKKRGIAVSGKPVRVVATPSAPEVAQVVSPPLAALVERMLTFSDNDLAEALSHLVGAAAGKGSFAGATSATTTQLANLGVPTVGLVIADGSGLARTDRVTSRSLSLILSKASSTSGPALWPLVSGLPVAGATGTLATRFGDLSTRAGRGVVRAKTGTLTSVSSLAGLVRDHSGRLLAFAVIADRRGDLLAAERALDRVAATLASCGCR